MRVSIPAAVLEFFEGGNTLWVHDARGNTVLRLQMSGKITSRACEPKAPAAHADVRAPGDLQFCVPQEVLDAAE